MKKILFLAFSLILPLISSGQDKFNFSDTMHHIIDVRNLEKDLQSFEKGFRHFNPYFNETFMDIILKSNVTQKPLIYLRNNDQFKPQLGVWYFYDTDSLIHGINYKWSYYNPGFNSNENLDLVQKEKKGIMNIMINSGRSNLS